MGAVIVIHGLGDARAALAPGRAVTFISARGAALYAGSGWWRALIDHARGEFPAIAIDDILDCADAAGLAVGALGDGQRRIVLDEGAPGWGAVMAIASSLGAEVLTSRPPSLDMADPDAVRRLHDWLHLRTTPGDSGDALS